MSSHDDVHSEARGRVYNQRDWHPSHITDLTVMGMDRVRGSLIGYNSRTGKIMHQKPHDEGPLRVSYTDGILLNSECMALGLLDGIFAWRTPVGRRHQLWMADSNSGWPARISHYTLVNRNDGAYCRCPVRPVNGPFRQTSMRQLEGVCVRWDEKHEMMPGHTKHIPGHHERIGSVRDQHCADLTTALSGDWFFTHHDKIQPSCLTTMRAEMASLEDRPHLRDLTRPPRMPRARIMTDIKHTARLLDAIDAPLAVLTVSIEVLAVQFRGLLEPLSRLHDHALLLAAERDAMYDTDRLPGDGITYAYNQSCDSYADSLVYDVLTADNLAYTPESSNVTRVSIAYAEYAHEHMTCLMRTMSSVGSALECAARWLDVSYDEPGSATTAETEAALSAVYSSLLPSKLLQIQKQGADADDRGDEVVRLVLTAAETMFRRVVSIFGTYKRVAIGWKRYNGTEVESGSVEDMWCCMVTTMISDDRYPPCLPRTVRLMNRELDKRLVVKGK